MKASTIFAGVFAAFASAAPTTTATTTEVQERGVVDLGAFNNFGFANQDLQYLNAINGFNLQAFAQLSAFNNLNIGNFQSLFGGNVFDINALLQLQQIALLSQLGGLGVFGNFDLSTVQFNLFDLGLINNIGSFNLGSIIDVNVIPQIQTIIQQTQIAAVVL
ncbi:hypothetical protein F4809DRAFT_476971 [Biscogniauxia mediterranea]|nr:hypothetical protein F4809DRAFT_476971 [Biscogniauxia mediterranea]